jgi:hypothetical protein
MAGISGLMNYWDQPVVVAADGAQSEVTRGPHGTAPSAEWDPAKRNGGQQPGAAVFDAVHRSLLVRFPEAARAIAGKISPANTLEKLELVIPFAGTELWPFGYQDPAGMSFLGNSWATDKPRWHASAHVLRKPWQAGLETGPTYNAAINGVSYWKKFGAKDVKEDRFPKQFGPAEVSAEQPEGRIDLTALVSDPEFGATLADRLQVISEQGVIIQKWEVYDMALHEGGYEWKTARGPQGILIGEPRLEATFKPGKSAETVQIGAPVDFKKRVESLRASKAGGVPSAVLPTEAEFEALKAKFGIRKLPWMPDWQWTHIDQLRGLGGNIDFPANYADYLKWLDKMLGFAPRRWDGFLGPKYAQLYFQYGEALPEPVKDHWRLYWWSWLMPDRANDTLVHGYIGGEAMKAYYKETRDWRGNASVYRTYVRSMGTVNFNSWATAGTLLGGAILENDFLMAEGRNGLDQFMMRTWSWFDGSHQESIDHYYLAHTLMANKVYADFGPTETDRLLGSMILTKNISEITGSYHPNLRRFISPSGRTGIAYLLAKLDGLQYILHTLSPAGTLTDMETKIAPVDVNVVGIDLQPSLVAEMSVISPWAPLWTSELIDEKSLPFEYSRMFAKWGAFTESPILRRGYLAENYGIASQDAMTGPESVPIMAQWRREARTVEKSTDLGTLLVRFGVNQTEFLDTLDHGNNSHNPNGVIGDQGGRVGAFQHRNKLIALASPMEKLAFDNRKPPESITSVQTSVALISLQDVPTWELFVQDGGVGDFRKAESLPMTLKADSRMVIRDGVTMVGVIALPTTDLGRDAAIIIDGPGPLTLLQGGGKGKTSLVINNYFYRSDKPLDPASIADLNQASGGFAIEMGDTTEFKTVDDFFKHISSTGVDSKVTPASGLVEVAYRSGPNTLTASFDPKEIANGNKIWSKRRVNGVNPLPTRGVWRDSPIDEQSTTGNIEKNGNKITFTSGRMCYVENAPKSGVLAVSLPFPDRSALAIEAANGALIRPCGMVGITSVVYQPKTNQLQVRVGKFDDPQTGDAEFLAVSAVPSAPACEVNQQPRKAHTIQADGKAVHFFGLNGDPAAWPADEVLLALWKSGQPSTP